MCVAQMEAVQKMHALICINLNKLHELCEMHEPMMVYLTAARLQTLDVDTFT